MNLPVLVVFDSTEQADEVVRCIEAGAKLQQNYVDEERVIESVDLIRNAIEEAKHQ